MTISSAVLMGPRLGELARELRCSVWEARARVVAVWFQCRAQGEEVLTALEIEEASDWRGFAEGMVAAGLAAEHEQGFRIIDMAQEVARIQSQRDKARRSVAAREQRYGTSRPTRQTLRAIKGSGSDVSRAAAHESASRGSQNPEPRFKPQDENEISRAAAQENVSRGCVSRGSQNPEPRLENLPPIKGNKKDSQSTEDKNETGPASLGLEFRSPAEILFSIWQEHRGELPIATPPGRQTKKAAAARWAEKPELSYWVETVKRMARSPFLCGRGKTVFIARFEWMLREGVHEKVASGQYDEWVAPNTPTPTRDPNKPIHWREAVKLLD